MQFLACMRYSAPALFDQAYRSLVKISPPPLGLERPARLAPALVGALLFDICGAECK